MTSSKTVAIIALLTWLGAAFGQEATLYQRLGGAPVMTRVVSQTVDAVVENPRLNRSFDKVDLDRLKILIVEQICSLAKGGCEYSGDDMKTTHDGLDVTEAEFYGLVEELIIALDQTGVGLREKNELLKLLAPMKPDIVTR